jgi:4-hydroxy-3-polyprenylbenzoate decarboxylase
MPAFYTRPESIEQLVDQFVMKVIDSMGIAHNLGRRWKEEA